MKKITKRFKAEWLNFLKLELAGCLENNEDADYDEDIRNLQNILDGDVDKFIETVHAFMIETKWDKEYMIPSGSEDRQFYRGYFEGGEWDYVQKEFHEFVQVQKTAVEINELLFDDLFNK